MLELRLCLTAVVQNGLRNTNRIVSCRRKHQGQRLVLLTACKLAEPGSLKTNSAGLGCLRPACSKDRPCLAPGQYITLIRGSLFTGVSRLGQIVHASQRDLGGGFQPHA